MLGRWQHRERRSRPGVLSCSLRTGNTRARCVATARPRRVHPSPDNPSPNPGHARAPPMCETFDLTDEDRYAIFVALNVAKHLVNHRRCTPEAAVAIAKAISAMERM